MSLIRPATPADGPGLWQVRDAVSETTLTPGRVGNGELRASITTTGPWGSDEVRYERPNTATALDGQ
jgi:hypothetical protein